MAKDMIRMLLVALSVVGVLLSVGQFAYADDSHSDNSSTVINVGISGDVKVDIGASGPSELNVEAKGPAQVSIDAGDEVRLNVEASDESQVFIKGQNPDEPAGDQESRDDGPSGDLGNQSSNLEDDVSRWNPYVVIISAAFPVLGVLTFIIIGLL